MARVPRHSRRLVLLLAALTASAPLSIDLYLPAFAALCASARRTRRVYSSR